MVKYILLFLISYPAISQNILIKGTVKDKTTNSGIPNVHIYAGNNNLNGTITNADGKFAINLPSSDKLIFSHVGYRPYVEHINRLNYQNLVVKLEQQVINLDEISVSAKTLTGEEIIDHAITKLKDNHKVEPASYDFHSMLVNFDKIDSTVHIIEEYHGTVHHDLFSNSKYLIKKCRIGAFSKIGNQKINEHRIIGADKMKIDNIFKYQDDYIHKRKHKRYNYTLIDRAIIDERMCYVIGFDTNEKTYYKTGKLYIDMDDYAIVRKILEDSKGLIRNQIDFVKNGIDEKWYLSSAMDYHPLFEDPSADYRKTIYYQNNSNVKYDLNSFKTWSPKDFVIDYANDFKDEFWEYNTFIPLPKWIREQIETAR